MKVTIDKCEDCGMLFENEADYIAHVAQKNAIKAFNQKYPKVEYSGCDFSNGGWNVPRAPSWVE